jgi:hypothetical protein
MKMAIYEAGKDLAVAYTWTETGGTNIGINLRWVQVGCKIPNSRPSSFPRSGYTHRSLAPYNSGTCGSAS